jgi:hypothetical protein
MNGAPGCAESSRRRSSALGGRLPGDRRRVGILSCSHEQVLFGFEQLFHGHRLVEMVFGLGDLFTGDQEPHIGLHLGPSAQRAGPRRVVPRRVAR